MNNGALKYQKLEVASLVDTADSHQLIKMLFDGALSRLKKARGCMEHGDHQGRSEAISATVSIIDGLQGSLDHDRGGDLADNLDSLYDYMQRRLFRVNTDNDPKALEEVADLIRTVRAGWDAIGAEVAQAS
jgi:flagellar protein FliS